MRVITTSVLVLCGTMIWASPGSAAPDPGASSPTAGGTVVDVGRAAVLPPEISPPLAPAVTQRFRAAVESGLTFASVVPVSAADTDQQRLATVGDCRTAACQGRLATALKAAWIFSPSLQRVGKNYKLRMLLFDPRGRITVDRTASCDICTLSEAIGKAQGLAQEAGTELRNRYVALMPRPEPPRRKARPRPEPPRRKARPRPRPRPVVVVPPPKPKPRPKPSIKQAAWMSASLGLASFVAGVTLLGLDGQYTCNKQPARLQCPYRYGTGTAGAVFTALGGASMVAGGVLFYYAYFRKKPSKEPPRATVGLAPTRGGVYAHAALRF